MKKNTVEINKLSLLLNRIEDFSKFTGLPFDEAISIYTNFSVQYLVDNIDLQKDINTLGQEIEKYKKKNIEIEKEYNKKLDELNVIKRLNEDILDKIEKIKNAIEEEKITTKELEYKKITAKYSAHHISAHTKIIRIVLLAATAVGILMAILFKYLNFKL